MEHKKVNLHMGKHNCQNLLFKNCILLLLTTYINPHLVLTTLLPTHLLNVSTFQGHNPNFGHRHAMFDLSKKCPFVN